MSDIPVGSPPAPPGRHAAPGGWYPDPLDAGLERYWDGWQWSRNTRASEAPAARRPPVQGAPGPYGTPPPGAYAAGALAGAARPAPLTADGVPLAAWGWRLLAGLLDGLATGVIATLFSLPLYVDLVAALQAYWAQAVRAAQSGGQPPPTPDLATLMSGTDQLLVGLVALAVGLAYHVPFLRFRGATPGLMLCGLRVVPLDEGRSDAPLGWGRVVGRALIWLVPWQVPGMFLLTVADVLLPLWHPRRQSLHDLAVRTQVVRPRR